MACPWRDIRYFQLFFFFTTALQLPFYAFVEAIQEICVRGWYKIPDCSAAIFCVCPSFTSYKVTLVIKLLWQISSYSHTTHSYTCRVNSLIYCLEVKTQRNMQRELFSARWMTEGDGGDMPINLFCLLGSYLLLTTNFYHFQKIKILTFMPFQNGMTFFLLWNIEDILRNVCMCVVNYCIPFILLLLYIITLHLLY